MLVSAEGKQNWQRQNDLDLHTSPGFSTATVSCFSSQVLLWKDVSRLENVGFAGQNYEREKTNPEASNNEYQTCALWISISNNDICFSNSRDKKKSWHPAQWSSVKRVAVRRDLSEHSRLLSFLLDFCEETSYEYLRWYCQVCQVSYMYIIYIYIYITYIHVHTSCMHKIQIYYNTYIYIDSDVQTDFVWKSSNAPPRAHPVLRHPPIRITTSNVVLFLVKIRVHSSGEYYSTQLHIFTIM